MRHPWTRRDRLQDIKYDLLSPAKDASLPTSNLWNLQWIVVAFLASNAISIFSTYALMHLYEDSACSMDLPATETLYNGIDRSVHLTRFSPFDPFDNKSVYTAAPSEDVDRAWEEVVGDVGWWFLPEHLGHDYGLDQSTHMFLEDGLWGPGTGGYFVQAWATHDLHCLDMLRKNLYYTRDYYAKKMHGKESAEWFRKAHLDHCIDALRERVMCTSDAGVLPFAWKGPGEKYHKPDFTTQHKCHNYEPLRQWIKEQEIDKDNPLIPIVGIPTPPDATFDAAGFRWGGIDGQWV